MTPPKLWGSRLPSPSGGNRSCQHHDLGLLASRVGGDCISVVFSTQLVPLCYGCGRDECTGHACQTANTSLNRVFSCSNLFSGSPWPSRSTAAAWHDSQSLHDPGPFLPTSPTSSPSLHCRQPSSPVTMPCHPCHHWETLFILQNPDPAAPSSGKTSRSLWMERIYC